MKKTFLLLFFALMSITAFADDLLLFRATSFCYKEKNSQGQWGDWSKWQDSDVQITMDLTTDIVTIYTKNKQVYQITDYVESSTDSDGDDIVKLRFIDQDGDQGTMRLIERNSENRSEIYIDFNNITWVYEVRRIE